MPMALDINSNTEQRDILAVFWINIKVAHPEKYTKIKIKLNVGFKFEKSSILYTYILNPD